MNNIDAAVLAAAYVNYRADGCSPEFSLAHAKEWLAEFQDVAREEEEDDNLLDRIDEAVMLAFQYGSIDGGHHKMWVIDQMVRALLGDDYAAWVEAYEEGGEYEWETGIAP